MNLPFIKNEKLNNEVERFCKSLDQKFINPNPLFLRQLFTKLLFLSRVPL